MMMASWMGSHFTNDDLVKESRFSGVREGVEVWQFVLTSRPAAAVVWGRIVLEVRPWSAPAIGAELALDP